MTSPAPLSEVLQASLDYIREKRRQRGAIDDLDEWLEAAPVPVPPKRLKRQKKMSEATAIQKADKPAQIVRMQPPEMGIPIDQLVARVQKVREVQARVMTEGQHYGNVPGTDKKCLFKPGAELLGLTFQLDPQFEVVERWEGQHLESVVTCTLYNAPTGTRLGSGVGSCSTKESRYAWRKGERTCPQCAKPAIIKGKEEYGGGWVCFKKKDGCGAKFKSGDKAIEGQQTGRVANEDIADQYNTVRKMACKRAHVAAILFVTCASEIFTQDLEDGPGGYSPHVGPGDDPEALPHDGGALGEELGRKLGKVKEALARCDTYDKALALRAIIGTRSQQSDLTKRLQAGKESGDVTARQAGEIDKLWHHCDRQVAKLEDKLKPSIEATYTDPPDREPGDDSDEDPL